MIIPSDAWLKAREQSILPETFVEISMNFEDADAHKVATVTASNEATFSESAVVVNDREIPADRYAFLEQNMWSLDGSKTIMEDVAGYEAPGYVSRTDSGAALSVRLSEVRTSMIPGITITWSTEHGEYATEFTVKVKKGTNTIISRTVKNNTAVSSFVDMEIANYDSVEITVSKWCVPGHRVRIERVMFGHTLVFDKSHLLSYTHEQTGDFTCTELPKNSIEFTIDNSDDRWNPLNKQGFEKYLSERLKITVRYGMDINGTVEWIPGGVFFLSEWRAPSNGLEATFAARDALEYMLNTPYQHETPRGRITDDHRLLYDSPECTRDYEYDFIVQDNFEILEYDLTYGSYRIKSTCFGETKEGWVKASRVRITTDHTFGQIVDKIPSLCGLPSDVVIDNVSSVKDESVAVLIGNMSVAELLQLICNAGSDALILKRDGNMKIGMPRGALGVDDYTIPLSLSYSYPEIELSKPLKKVVLTGSSGVSQEVVFGTSGEVVEIQNPLVEAKSVYSDFSKYYKRYWNRRETVSGEFRGEPLLDVFDAVSVETKFGKIDWVVLTSVKYTYTGTFHCSYTGRVM